MHLAACKTFEESVADAYHNGIQGSMSDLDRQLQRQLLEMLCARAQYVVLLPFSRKHKPDADQIGLTYMA
jgi:hypothetical protein